MNYPYLDVELSGKNEKTLKLRYEIRHHDVGKIWASCLEKATTHGLKETDRFSGFSDQVGQLLIQLRNTISKLKKNPSSIKFSGHFRTAVAGIHQ